MSEVQSARTGNSRGRGGFRGGRGGYRGGRNPSRPQKDEQDDVSTSLDDQGEVGELKRKFGDQIPLLREVCPGWSDEDLVFALEETNGDLEAAVDRISSGKLVPLVISLLANNMAGTISQWGEVKKKQPKSKDASSSAEVGATRGRGRGAFEGRGRGRGAERGARGSTRGARAVSQANGTKHPSKQDDWDTPAATTETQGDWDKPATGTTGAWDKATTDAGDSWAAPTNGDGSAQAAAIAPVEEMKSAASSAAAAKKSGGWAGLFAKPPPAPKPTPAPIPAAMPEVVSAPTATAPAEEPVQHLPPPIEPQDVEDAPSELPSAPHSEGPSDLPPSKDELTETNLDQLPDESHPVASQTVASTTASTQDPLAQTSAKAPIRPASGYAATALKATGAGARSASFARKVKEQQEAVVMPGNHAMEKAAVQFGKMGLNGDGEDAEEDREEPETRTQLPDDSPVAPRASLPPALPQAHQAQQAHQLQAQPEIQPPTEPQAQRQAPGLPPAPQQAQQQQAPQVAPGFGDPYRYGQGGKTYDPFGQPPTTQAPSASQEPFASQVPGQAQTSAQNDMAGYYSREAYQQYYGYGQHQDAHRAGSAFGSSGQDIASQYATAGPQRGYGQPEAQHSGNNTPAPGAPAQQQQHQQQQSQQQQQMGAGGHAGYPYGYPGSYGQQYPQYSQSYMNQMAGGRYGANRPMFDDARRQQQDDYYGNQYAYGQNQHYGGGSYKSSMYGQPHQQYSHDYSSSPANAGSYGGRESGYARSGSTQPSEQQASGNAGFGSVPDPFGRSSSGYGQNQSLQHGGSHQGSEDATKASGPSPALQGGRPGSTTNSSQAQQSGLGQGQSQQAFGGYPQYGGGFSNFGGQQQGAHPTSGYGAYGAGAFGTYGSYGSGGGRGWNH